MPFAFQPVFLLSDGKRFGSVGRWERLRMDNSNYSVGTDRPAFECSEMSLFTAQPIQHMLTGQTIVLGYQRVLLMSLATAKLRKNNS
jgi:hypothetical protein